MQDLFTNLREDPYAAAQIIPKDNTIIYENMWKLYGGFLFNGWRHYPHCWLAPSVGMG